MKSDVFVFVLLALLLASCHNQNQRNLNSDLISNPVSADKNNLYTDEPAIELLENNFDFGVVIQGEKVSHIFKLKNKGKKDLIIGDVSASCGCTVPKFSSQPIKPGDEGQIEVIFNSSGRMGKQIKNLTIYANTTPNKTQLTFTADVIVPETKN